jgi:HSP20 family molecular chaperone IbpA
MARLRTVVVSGALGAALAYLFDPEMGSARRARLLNQLGGTLRQGRRELDRAARRIENGARGAVAQVDRADRPAPTDDLSVLSRVESVLFGMPGFPKGSVNAEVVDGRLVLRGEVKDDEQAREIVRAATGVAGVVAVESLLHPPGTPAPNKAASRRVSARQAR